MRYLITTCLVVISVTTIVMACKKREEKSLTLIRDCTATYLRDGDVDLPVANPEYITEIDSGQVITVLYYYPGTKKVKFNYGDDCGTPHEYPRGEWIMVEEYN